MYKISIIMPVYNGEKYLAEAIESVLNQTFSDFELLIIDDGSTDNSARIINDYAKKDNRIHPISQKNSGVSAARNNGIEVSRGEYICFVDADDKLKKNYLSYLYEEAVKNHADMMVCGYSLIDKKSKQRNINIEYIYGNIAENTSSFSPLIKAGLGISIWNKFIKRSLINKYNIRFDPDMHFDEDLFFSWKTACAANSIFCCPNALYNYRLTSNSTITKYHPNIYRAYCRAFDKMERFLKKNNLMYDDYYKDTEYIFTDKLSSIATMIFRSPLKYAKKKAVLNDILNDTRIINDKSAGNLLKMAGIQELKTKIERMIR